MSASAAIASAADADEIESWRAVVSSSTACQFFLKGDDGSLRRMAYVTCPANAA